MEGFIASYSLDFASFRETARLSNAFIAGSSTLSLYLQENGQSIYEPGDLDIFLNGMSHRNSMIAYLVTNGYIDTKKFDDDIANKYSAMEHVIRLDSFSKNEKEIQIVTLHESQHVTEYISCLFDLSVCATWWNPYENQLVSLNPELTLQKKMYMNSTIMRACFFTNSLTQGQKDRIIKYKERGFTMVSGPFDSIYTNRSRDYRRNLIYSILTNTTAFDVCAYEDVNCIMYLKKSLLNIIIKTGEQMQAYDRNVLAKYMTTHSHILPAIQKTVFTTPTQQCLYLLAVKTLLYSDYSIFELIDPETHIDSKGESQTVYSLCCYTIDQWNSNSCGEIISYVSHYVDYEQYYENIYSDNDTN
jgi:hypothetical protein